MLQRKKNPLNFKSKKANAVTDGALVIVMVIIFAIVSMLAFKVWGEMKDDVLGDITQTEATDTINEIDTRYPSVMDGLVVLAFVLLWVMAIATSFIIDTHPIFFIGAFVLLVFLIIAGAMLGNFYEELFSDSDLNALPSQFPATNWLLSNLLLVGGIVVFSIALALYGKSKL